MKSERAAKLVWKGCGRCIFVWFQRSWDLYICGWTIREHCFYFLWYTSRTFGNFVSNLTLIVYSISLKIYSISKYTTHLIYSDICSSTFYQSGCKLSWNILSSFPLSNVIKKSWESGRLSRSFRMKAAEQVKWLCKLTNGTEYINSKWSA